jgi:16S rRNA C1402 (ribose-2'-O) methylase RsmI
VRGKARELAERFAVAPKGEITLVFGPAMARRPPSDLASAAAAVTELIAAGVPRRRAARIVARLTGISPNRLYQSSL